jgi:hypothetical protein
MEQHTQDAASPEIMVTPEPKVSPEIKVSPEPNAPRRRQRCRARRRDLKQCRLFAQDPATGLCARHAAYAETLPDELQDSTDLSKEILVVDKGDFGTTENINAILSNVIELVAKGRISTRRAAVITYALSLMLRNVVVADRKVANTPPRIDWGPSWNATSKDEPAASSHDNADSNPQAYPQTSDEAIENYARLRT